MPKKKKLVRKKSEPKLDFSLYEEIDDEKRKQIVAVLLNGIRSEFWLIIKHILDRNIEDTTETILDPDKYTPEEREKWVRWLSYMKELRDLPKLTADMLLPEKKQPEPDDQVYD